MSDFLLFLTRSYTTVLSSTCFCFCCTVLTMCPSNTFFIKLNDYLWPSCIGYFSWNQVSSVCSFPTRNKTHYHNMICMETKRNRRLHKSQLLHCKLSKCKISLPIIGSYMLLHDKILIDWDGLGWMGKYLGHLYGPHCSESVSQIRVFPHLDLSLSQQVHWLVQELSNECFGFVFLWKIEWIHGIWQ